MTEHRSTSGSPSSVPGSEPARRLARWWIYQNERFPLLGHGPLIAAFSFSAVAYSRMLREDTGLPSLWGFAVAFLTALTFFLQLRIADEFKDFEDDARWRPYRPVPRGLVKLSELRWVFIGGAVIQLCLALAYYWPLTVLLCIVWIYLALMSKEFFVHAWLKAHPITYMLSHMAIMPLIDLYATSSDWLPRQSVPPRGLLWFLLTSYFNGLVVEIGRKIRSPQDEEEGVQTYSALWGRGWAIGAWLLAMGLTTGFALLAAHRIRFTLPVAVLLGGLMLLAIGLSIRFFKHPLPRAGKKIEAMAGVWTILMYLGLGAIPIAWRIWGGGQ